MKIAILHCGSHFEIYFLLRVEQSDDVDVSLAAQTIPQPTVIGVDGGEGSGILTYLPLFRATKKRSPNQI